MSDYVYSCCDPTGPVCVGCGEDVRMGRALPRKRRCNCCVTSIGFNTSLCAWHDDDFWAARA